MEQKIPNHIVLFPDGNRRWAKEKGLPSLEGHLAGEEKFHEFLFWCKNRGIKVVTVFGFSTENWNRSREEVDYLMKLLDEYLNKGFDNFQKENVRLRVIGQKNRVPIFLQNTIDKIEKETKGNSEVFLNLAISYGGRWDILNAVKNIIKEGIDPDKIDEKVFEEHLSTAGLPAPDLVIRAGGEKRMSNFVLWQAAYSELYFCPKFWPDFSEQDFNEALEEFDRRSRRFGK